MIAENVMKLEQENISLRAQLKEVEELYGDKAELPKNCEYCKNFMQHYIKIGITYSPTCDGHCVAGNRVKNRKVGEKCKYFIQKEYGKNYI
ncbi:MAG: hypothetical protein J6D08_16625 [Lachnospiraceae bacterium]|nr:hypothetical protein [Lachnospiraceae bacterium]